MENTLRTATQAIADILMNAATREGTGGWAVDDGCVAAQLCLEDGTWLFVDLSVSVDAAKSTELRLQYDTPSALPTFFSKQGAHEFAAYLTRLTTYAHRVKYVPGKLGGELLRDSWQVERA